MKKVFFAAIATISIAFTACSGNNDKSKKAEAMSGMQKDSPAATATSDDTDIKMVKATYSNVDPKVAASLKEVLGRYLQVKNSLANDNADEAARGAKSMSDALAKVDKSLFTAEQKNAYDQVEDDLKEHAEHIGKSRIDHQREHFSMMSEDVYSIAKTFGSGQPLYHDHCPMADGGKGAMWLSELKEIKNPYMGSKMQKCGTVEEKIQ